MKSFKNNGNVKEKNIFYERQEFIMKNNVIEIKTKKELVEKVRDAFDNRYDMDWDDTAFTRTIEELDDYVRKSTYGRKSVLFDDRWYKMEDMDDVLYGWELGDLIGNLIGWDTEEFLDDDGMPLYDKINEKFSTPSDVFDYITIDVNACERPFDNDDKYFHLCESDWLLYSCNEYTYKHKTEYVEQIIDEYRNGHIDIYDDEIKSMVDEYYRQNMA